MVLVVVAVLVGRGLVGSAATRADRVEQHAGGTVAKQAPLLVDGTGGTVTVDVPMVPETLNDHTVAGDDPGSEMVASCIWAQVFELGPGPGGAVGPQLSSDVVQSAEVISVSPQTVVYKIDPQAVWSDGVPITAADFVYAWQAQRGDGVDVDGLPDSVASTMGYRDILSVTGSNGGRTVTVVFKTPFADWESLFDDLLPAHIAERVGWNAGFDSFDPTALVSGGPWRVTAWTPGSQIVLERNPRWWGTTPKLDKIVLDTTGGEVADEASLRSGGADLAYETDLDQSLLAQVSSSDSLDSHVYAGTSLLQLVFNTRRVPLDSALVRQGVAHGIDRTALTSAVVDPLAPTTRPDDDHLFANVQPVYADDGTAYDAADLDSSGRLLTEAGLVQNAGGTWTSKDAPVVLSLAWAYDDPWSEAVGPVVAADLVGAGFDVRTDPVTEAELSGSVLPAGDFDLALVPMGAGIYPASTAAVFSTASGLAGTGTSPDWSGFDDPKIDALFTQAAEDLNAATAASTYQQIDQDLWTAMPTLPLFAEPTLLVSSTWVTGVKNDPGGPSPMWQAGQWARLVAAPTKG